MPHIPSFKAELLAPKWTLVRVDPPEGEVFEGHFHAEDLSEDLSTNWAELAIGQRKEPAIQWTHGNARKFSFRATFYSRDITDEIETQIRKLREAITRDDKLKRPPCFMFVYGQISEVVFVESLGGARYQELWGDGRAKQVEFQITLRVVTEPLTILETDPTAPVHLSRYKPIVAGSTYETIAASEYGDPIYGVFLRQDALAAFPGPGTIVRVPRASYYTRRDVAPKSYSLGDSPEAQAARRAVLDDRSQGVAIPGFFQG